jgi:hypothetical protein
MKNEWDMFAAVRKQLDAGAALVTVYLTSPTAQIPGGQLGEAIDEAGESYELGTEFIAAFQECIRAARIPWHYSPVGKRWAFGPGLVDAQPRPTLPGELNIDLTNERTELFFGPEDDANTTRWTS